MDEGPRSPMREQMGAHGLGFWSMGSIRAGGSGLNTELHPAMTPTPPLKNSSHRLAELALP